jgi:hypothetical protein
MATRSCRQSCLPDDSRPLRAKSWLRWPCPVRGPDSRCVAGPARVARALRLQYPSSEYVKGVRCFAEPQRPGPRGPGLLYHDRIIRLAECNTVTPGRTGRCGTVTEARDSQPEDGHGSGVSIRARYDAAARAAAAAPRSSRSSPLPADGRASLSPSPGAAAVPGRMQGQDLAPQAAALRAVQVTAATRTCLSHRAAAGPQPGPCRLAHGPGARADAAWRPDPPGCHGTSVVTVGKGVGLGISPSQRRA